MADKKIDPRLYIPLVEGYDYDDPFLERESAEGGTSDGEEINLSEVNAGLQPPGSVMVVDQIFRKGADGKILVDLVLEVEDMPGATEYEVRLATV